MLKPPTGLSHVINPLGTETWHQKLSYIFIFLATTEASQSVP